MTIYSFTHSLTLALSPCDRGNNSDDSMYYRRDYKEQMTNGTETSSFCTLVLITPSLLLKEHSIQENNPEQTWNACYPHEP